MKVCATTGEILRKQKAKGWSDSALKALRSYIEENRSDPVTRMSQWGSIAWAVVNDEWDKQGPLEKAVQYRSDVEGLKGTTLNRVVNLDELVVLEVGPIGDVKATVAQIRKADPTVDLSKIRTYEDIKNALLESGYDGIATGDSEIRILDIGKVAVDSKVIDGNVTEDDLNVGWNVPKSSAGLGVEVEIDSTTDILQRKYPNGLPIKWNGKGLQYAPVIKVELGESHMTVYTSRYKLSFAYGSDRSVTTKSGKFVEVDGLANVSYDIQVQGWKLGSKEDVTVQGTTEVDVHGDTAKMIDFMKQLNNISGTKADSEFVSYLDGLISGMDAKFFTIMKTYFNDQANNTQGNVTVDGIEPTNTDRIDIEISKMKHAGNEQSGAEVYAHEVVHAYTLFALLKDNTTADGIKRELRYLRERVRDQLNKTYRGDGWKVFMPNESIDVKVEEKNAKEAWKYVFENDKQTAVAEFVAYMATNPLLVAAAKNISVTDGKEKNKTVFEKIIGILSTIMGVLSGQYKWGSEKKSTQGEVVRLIGELGKINNNAQIKINESQSAINRISQWFDDKDEQMGEKIADYWEKTAGNMLKNYKPMPRGKGKLAYAKWLATSLPLLLTNKQMRPIAGHILKMMGMSSTGLVQNIMRDFRSTDELQRAIHKVMRMAGKIDRVREGIATAYRDSIYAGFTKKLTEEQEKALTAVVLDTDLQSIWDKYTPKEIVELLNNESELKSEITKAKTKLVNANSSQANWNVAQAEGLGYKMATGKASLAQNENAENIATGTLQFNDKRVPKDGEVAAIDHLATLTALMYSDSYKKQQVAKLVQEETIGVENIIKQHKFFVEHSREQLFEGEEKFMIKGYSKELLNSSVIMEVAPLNEETLMQGKGYKKAKELEVDDLVGGERMAIYVSDAFNRQEYYRTTARLTGTGSRGTSIMQLMLNNKVTSREVARTKKKFDIERKKLVLEMEKGNFNLDMLKEINTHRSPIIDPEGNVIDYRYTMSKKNKEELFEQDTAVSKVLSRSLAGVYDKVATKEHNEEVLQLIKDDMDVNYTHRVAIGNNGYEYVRIGAKVGNAQSTNIWKMLPKEMKMAITQMPNGEIAVREDMVEEYFGFRHFSAANTEIIKYFPHIVKTAIKVAEELWQAIVSVAKIDILIRTPFVIIGNIVNNMIFSYQTNTSIIDVIRMYINQVKNIKEYMRKHKELMDLEAALSSGNVLKKDVERIASLRSDLQDNPIHELFELGIYESVVEDLNETEAKEKGLLNSYVQEKSKNAPEWAKTGWNWFTLNSNTGWYKNMELLLRMGDLVGQAVENEKRKTINNQKLEKLRQTFIKNNSPKQTINRVLAAEKRRLDDERLTSINEDFIFYSAPASVAEEYANRMGAVMFTKFYKRYQRVVGKTVASRPMRALFILGMDQFLFSDGLETPMDQLAIDKMIDGRALNMIQNPANILWHNTPIALRGLTGNL